jgi:hypothetical protein
MVHALLACWRTLKAEGVLIDLRPLVSNPAIEIVTPNQTYLPGHINDQAGKVDDDAADSAVSEIVRRGHFVLETRQSFQFNLYFNTFEEMFVFVGEKWAQFAHIPTAVIEQSRQTVSGLKEPYKVRVSEEMQMGMYSKRP